MSTPQEPRRRLKQKARRTKQLAAWRAKRADGQSKKVESKKADASK